MDIYSKAKAELNSIDQQIATLQRRQVELRQFVSLGSKLFDAAPVQAMLIPPDRLAAQEGKTTVLPCTPRPRDGSMKARVLDFTESHIRNFGRIHTKQLIECLEANGIEIGGADKAVTVGVILSRSNRFQADRSHGWGLVESKENPQDAPTSAGSIAV